MIYKKCIQCNCYHSYWEGKPHSAECEDCGFPRVIWSGKPPVQWRTEIQVWNDSLTKRLGFKTDPANSALGLTSEVGELTDIIRKLEGMKKVKEGDAKATTEALASEIADVLVYLLQIATHYNIDVHNAFLDKKDIIERRTFKNE